MVVATQNCADHKLSSRRSSLKCFLHSCFPKKRDVSVRNDEAKFLSGKLSNSLLSTHWDSRGSSRESSRTVTTSATTVTTPRATCKSPPSMSPRLPAASHFRADDSSVSPAVFYTPQQDVFPQTQHTARGSSRAFIRSFFTLFWATPRRQGLRCYFRKSALRNPDTATQPTLTTETLFRSLPDLSERSTRSSGSSSFCTALSRTDMDTVTPLGLTRAQIANDGRHTHLGSGTNVKGTHKHTISSEDTRVASHLSTDVLLSNALQHAEHGNSTSLFASTNHEPSSNGCSCGYPAHRRLYDPEMPLFTDPRFAQGSYDEALAIAKACCGRWVTMLERSESLDAQYRHLGLNALKRAVMNRIAIPLTMFLEEKNTILHCWIHTPLGVRHMRSSLLGEEVIDEDSDVGAWRGLTQVVNYSIPWFCNGTPVRALQQVRQNSERGTCIETRCILPDALETKIMLFNFSMIPKLSDTFSSSPPITLSADRLLRIENV